MSVYVDNMRAKLGRLIMCHMIADSSEELHAMAAKIGVRRDYVQHSRSAREHYDICLSKRALAVANGAHEITIRQYAWAIQARKGIAPPRHRV